MGATPRSLPNLLVVLAAGLALAGCGGKEHRYTPEDNLSELAFEKDRALVALRSTLDLEREGAEDHRLVHREKETLAEDLAHTENSVRYLSQEIHRLGGERSDLEKQIGELKESEKRTRENHARLLEMASSSRDELADLKSKVESGSSEKSRLETENGSFQKQLELAHRELEETRGELTRTRAVVRSFQEGSPSAAAASESALRSRVQELEESLRKARSESGEVAGTEPPAGDQSPPRSAKAPPGGAERTGAASLSTPGAVWSGLRGLAKERIPGYFNGKFRGDGFDWVVSVGAGGILLVTLVLAIGRFRVRRLRRELEELRAGASSSREAADEEPEAAVTLAISAGRAEPQPEQDLPRPSPRRSPRSASSRDFSAVISTSRPARRSGASPEPAAERDEVSEPAPAERIAAAPAPSIAPRRQDQREASAAASPGRPATAAPGATRPAAAPASSTPATAPASRPAVKPAVKLVANPPAKQDDEEDGANTQIIDALSPGGLKAPVKPKALAIDGDKDLLNELKAVINKKFDQLLK